MDNFTKQYSLANFIKSGIKGNIKFPARNKGKLINLDDGNEVKIFRQVLFNKIEDDDTNAVLFHVKFHLKGMPPKMNKIFSLFPIPLFVGLPGFCAKFWCLDTSNGDFHGFYKWITEEHADAYSKSFAMKFMSKRSVPESIGFEILEYKNNKYNTYPDIA